MSLSRENRGKLLTFKGKTFYFTVIVVENMQLLLVFQLNFAGNLIKLAISKLFSKKCIDKFAKVEYTNNIKDSKGAVS